MVAYHRLCFKWQENLSLEIEWSKGKSGDTILPSGIDNLIEADAEESLDIIGKRGVPAICWRETDSALFECLQLRESTEYLIDIIIPGTIDDAKQAWELNHVYPLPERLAKYYRTHPPKRWQQLASGVKLSGTLNFNSHVGVALLELPGATPLRFEVACIKFNYFEDLKALLASIAEESINLLLDVDTPTSASISSDVFRQADTLSQLFNYRKLMTSGMLEDAIETILASPHNATRTHESLVPLPLCDRPALDLISSRLTGEHFTPGGSLSDLFGGYTPTHLPQVRKVESIDTVENRYVKAFLTDLQSTGEDLYTKLVKANRQLSAGEVYQWNTKLLEWLSEPLWREVGELRIAPGNSQVLLRREGYKDVRECDLTLQVGLQLSWKRGLEISTGLDGDIRPISELYEYWCFFVLRSCLRKICSKEVPRSSPLYQTTPGNLLENLRKGKESQIIYEYSLPSGTPARVYLYYNREFRRTSSLSWEHSYSARLHPDYSILIEVLGDAAPKTRHWLHFDAKYRLDYMQWVSELTDSFASVEDEVIDATSSMDADHKDTFKRGDLYKMHTYRDALLGTRGSYILYPGSTEKETVYIRQPNQEYPVSDFYFPSVGAFQLRPSSNTGQREILEEFIGAVIEKVCTSANYVEEKAFY